MRIKSDEGSEGVTRKSGQADENREGQNSPMHEEGRQEAQNAGGRWGSKKSLDVADDVSSNSPTSSHLPDSCRYDWYQPIIPEQDPDAFEGRAAATTDSFQRARKPTGLKEPKGIFARQRDAQEQAMIVSLAKMGLTASARSKAQRLRAFGCDLTKETTCALDSMVEGQHVWRSKWSAYRPSPSFEQNIEKRKLIEELKETLASEKDFFKRGSTRVDEDFFFRETKEAILEYNATVLALDMWELRIRMPFKSPEYSRVVNVDRTFTIEDLKKNLYELEGFHPVQQILYVLQPELLVKQKVTGTVPKKLREKFQNLVSTKEPSTRRILLEGGEESTLADLNVHSGTVFEMAIDKKASKELQRQMLMKKIGLEGETFLKKTEEAFKQFDLDEGGTIEGDELGMTMKSLDIYLTEDEINELICKYDENGDRQFDIDEFRTMVKDVITGDIDKRQVLHAHAHVAGQISRASSSESCLKRNNPTCHGRISRASSGGRDGRFSRTSSAAAAEAIAMLRHQQVASDGLQRLPSSKYLKLKADSFQDEGGEGAQLM